mgnify:FL=1
MAKTFGQGFMGAAAFRHKLGGTAATWGGEITCRTGDLVRILSESMGGGPAYLADDSVHNAVTNTSQAFRDQGETGTETWSGTVEAYMRYRGLDSLIAHAFGAANGAPTNESGVVYSQYFYPSDTLANVFGTLCIDKVHNVAEFDSVKVNSMTITATAGERVRVSFDIIARDFNNDSTVNPNATLWSDPDTAGNREYINFEDADVYLDVWSGITPGAITAADKVYPSEFSITLTNSLVGDVTTRNSPLIDEPMRDGFAEVTGSLTFPIFGDTVGTADDVNNSEVLEDGMLAKSNFSLQIDFVGSTIVGSYNNELKLFLPNIEFTSSEANIGGPGKIGHRLNFVSVTPVAVGSFLASKKGATYKYPLWCEILNRENINKLATS